MPIRYTRVGWQDAPSTETPIDAANLNHMDNGILALSEEVDTELPLLRDQINDVSANIETQIDEKMPPEVSSWLTEHVTPAGSAVVVDDTLTIQGAAADAKKTGDEIFSLKEETNGIELGLDNVFDTELATSNIFDNNFDSSGYIDPSTGADASSSSYKRTSKFYEITDATATYLTVRLSGTISPFTVIFYDSAKNCLGNGAASNVTVKQITIPSGSRYFRIYTDASYNLDAYVGTVYVESIVPYQENYIFRDDSIEGDYLASELKNSYNLIQVINDNKYLNYANGSVSNNVDAYRVSDMIGVEASTDYYCGLFNDANAPTMEINAISVAFYDANGTYISGVYSSGNTHANCTWANGLLSFTSPSGASYARMGTNDSADPYKWLFVKATDSKLYTTKGSIKVDIDNMNVALQGKVVACFGDSIIGNTRDNTSTPFYVSKACGATVLNFGFGGCRMSVHASGWDNCSMYRISDDIYNNDFSGLVSAITSGWSGMPGYFKNTVAWLSACDFSTVDAIVISYGTNDYREPTSVLDNPENKFDTSTVCGALRYSIKQILSRYPDIQILVTCPVFRTFFTDGTTTPSEYSDTKDWGSGTLLDYAEAYRKACNDMNVPFLDLYHETSFNPYTRLNFFPADDGTHPNEKGRKRIGNIIGGKLKTLLPNT